jgi:hypothetical protein
MLRIGLLAGASCPGREPGSNVNKKAIGRRWNLIVFLGS